MERYVIDGKNKLYGKIEAESAKNSVLPLLSASILADGETRIISCPEIKDVLNMSDILKELGVKVKREGKDLLIDATYINGCEVPEKQSREIRSSIFLLGAVLTRFHKAVFPYPGGCDIGLRPIDLHLNGLRKMGVTIVEEEGRIKCFADKIVGATIYLDFPSVGATENIMIAASLAEGETVIHNPAKEPEIVDLQNFLNKMGAKISGAPGDTIRITGVKKLCRVDYKPMFDRIEAGTFMIAAAMCGGEVEIANAKEEKFHSLIDKISDNACKIYSKDDIIYIVSKGVARPINVETGPYPGFPTDLQAPILSYACYGKGVSFITENVFETRFKQVAELKKMGADIRVMGRTAVIKGRSALHGAAVKAQDLRGGAALVLAALKAEGISVIEDIYHVERGYWRFEEKLSMLGAKIIKKRTKDER